jgi:hypothetical protein
LAEKWIQKALKPSTKGVLHKELGIPQSKKIPAKKLETSAHKQGKLGKRARLAETLRGLNK